MGAADIRTAMSAYAMRMMAISAVVDSRNRSVEYHADSNRSSSACATIPDLRKCNAIAPRCGMHVHSASTNKGAAMRERHDTAKSGKNESKPGWSRVVLWYVARTSSGTQPTRTANEARATMLRLRSFADDPRIRNLRSVPQSKSSRSVYRGDVTGGRAQCTEGST